MKVKIKRFFHTEEAYRKNISVYTKVDGIIAVVYYLIFMITYYVMGRIYVEKQLYLGITCNIGLAILCIMIVLLRKQKLVTLGLTLKKMKKAVILGTILGVLMVLINNVTPAITTGCQFNQLTKILLNIFYYFVFIAFVEEIVFRGFIQTRIYGLIKNDNIAIIVVALMFSLMHIPFQMALSDTDIISFIFNNVTWLILLFLWHVVFNFLHRKYNSIITNTIFHGFMDWGNNLFV